MSEIKVNSIKGVGASTAAISVNNSDGTCTANITNKPNRNLIINGAMQVAQRGTSATGLAANGYATVDRFAAFQSGTDAYIEQHQVDVSSGTTPYTLGFRKAFQVKNGNQTSGAGASDYIYFNAQAIEAQNLANSGWNFKSSSSNITLSFYVKSSVAQNFYFQFDVRDGTRYNYTMETGSLTADTWTKVTKTIPGNSNLTIDNDNGVGAFITFGLFWGTNYTGSMSLNTWGVASDSLKTPNNTSTWYTTNDATFEITGVQLEVGSVATDFEHRSFAQELALCQRYFYNHVDGTVDGSNGANTVSSNATFYTNTNVFASIQFPVQMRAKPTLEVATGTNFYGTFSNGSSLIFFAGTSTSLDGISNRNQGVISNSNASGSGGNAAMWRTDNTGAKISFNAEL